MKETPEKPLGLERVKRCLYDKGLDERGAGCVLCGSCYGHGPVNPMEDEPGFKSKCPPYEYYRFQRFTPKSRWLMSQRVFHGLESITPELKEIIYTCTTCLMCQEICGVRNLSQMTYNILQLNDHSGTIKINYTIWRCTGFWT